MRKIQVSNNGTIDTLINFSLKTFCDDTDFKSFPDDIYKCCYQIQPHLNPVSFMRCSNNFLFPQYKPLSSFISSQLFSLANFMRNLRNPIDANNFQS